MFVERPVHPDLKALLMSGEQCQYAILVKFERPSRPNAGGRTSTSRERYAYLTNASRDVVFDDKSTNLQGVPNGEQTYLANKVLNVGNVQEFKEARASTYNITLDGNGIGARASGQVIITQAGPNVWDIKWPVTVDLVDAGFREGDKINLTGVTSGAVNIEAFRGDNILRVSKIDQALTTGSGQLTVTLASEEIKSILLDKNVAEYASFINREVYIYRAYFVNGVIVGEPITLFKGIISSVNFDDTDKGIQVNWGMTSHWGDFQQVRGRITSDDYHRALDASGIPQPVSALKTAYAYDKGFIHAETSLNLLATYSVQVEKQDIQVKKGFLGIFGNKVKVKKYYATESRNTQLDFQLQAKSVPVIYGVRSVTGIPIFADTLNNNSNIVYAAYVLGEGEVSAIYDVIIEGNSLICSNKSDFDARSTQNSDNTVQVVCRGRADRGDVLGGTTSVNKSAVTDFYQGNEYLFTDFNYNYTMNSSYYGYTPPQVTTADTVGKGVIDGESMKLTSPQPLTIDFFSGRPGQKAASQLVDIAKAGNFKIQNSYWTGKDTAEYWGPNHRLVDTAYVVVKYEIGEGSTTIPDIQFIVKGKAIECYNYDYSYSQNPKLAATESADNFLLGSIVSLYKMDGTLINSNVQIIDKWTLVNPDGRLNTRFRFSSPPNLSYDFNGFPQVTEFYMQNASGQRWTMITHNYLQFVGEVVNEISTPITQTTTVGGYLAFQYNVSTTLPHYAGSAEAGPLVSLYREDYSFFDDTNLFNSARVLNSRQTLASQYVTKLPASTQQEAQQTISSQPLLLASRNTVALAYSASLSTVDNYYAGSMLRISRYDPVTDKQTVQERLIIGYSASARIVTIDDVWDQEFLPRKGDKIEIFPKYRDTRTSINPAIQTLDYVTSPVYGRGLHVTKDLYLPSWLYVARVCDKQSDVTVNHGTVASVSGTYRYPATGPILWQGRVVASDGNYTQFTDVIGKLSHAWNSWRVFEANQLVHYEDRLYKVVSNTQIPTAPTHTAGTIGNLQLVTNVHLTSTSGKPNLPLFVGGNPVRAKKDGVIIPGYSLYDCDEIDYWRYLGWDEFSQRYVTQHQTNITVDTSMPLFDNTNSLLDHFGGVMRYCEGRYHLDIEQPVGSIADDEVRTITNDHIIGKIKLSDEGVRGAYNQLTASFVDPGNKFEARNISFFNSDFLKADRNVPKKGNLSVPGITNYYNTRILADKFLNKSRYGLKINLSLTPRGVLLLPGSVIQIQQDKYDWQNKKFRIDTVTHQDDTTVDVTAEEYDDSFYGVSNLSRQAGTGMTGVGSLSSLIGPTGLTTTNVTSNNELVNGIRISWTNTIEDSSGSIQTEIYSSKHNTMFSNILQISANQVQFDQTIGLQVGDPLTSQSSTNGLLKDKTYYVREIINSNTITLTETPGGSIVPLQNGSNLYLQVRMASLLAVVPLPGTSYLDSFTPKQGREQKYYWIRYKVIQE